MLASVSERLFEPSPVVARDAEPIAELGGVPYHLARRSLAT
jgi:hypothetical protein